MVKVLVFYCILCVFWFRGYECIIGGVNKVLVRSIVVINIDEFGGIVRIF